MSLLSRRPLLTALLVVVALFGVNWIVAAASDDPPDTPPRAALLDARALLVEVDRNELCHCVKDRCER
jgi:hypothetical protein